MKINFMLACSFCVLFVSTNFVNKYVLSVLRFTYPTIFQGWQTLVGVVMFRALISTGHVDTLLTGREWHECALWLPGMMCFLVSIYSGSRALATLPIPVFFVMQNIVLVFKATADLMFHKQITSLYSYVMLMISLGSALIVAKTDPQYHPDGYLWMCVHVVSLGVFEIYTNLMKGRLKLRATERLFCCYFYSVVVLAPCSYFLGDALEAARFPYLYFAKFYMGCILSGVLGMLMNLTAIRLHELSPPNSLLEISTVQGAAKIACSCASLAFYDLKTSPSFALFLAINHLCSFSFCESSTQTRPTQSELGAANAAQTEDLSAPPDKSFSPEVAHLMKRHELQQDMIRIELS